MWVEEIPRRKEKTFKLSEQMTTLLDEVWRHIHTADLSQLGDVLRPFSNLVDKTPNRPFFLPAIRLGLSQQLPPKSKLFCPFPSNQPPLILMFWKSTM
jgi:hypothetical protein